MSSTLIPRVVQSLACRACACLVGAVVLIGDPKEMWKYDPPGSLPCIFPSMQAVYDDSKLLGFYKVLTQTCLKALPDKVRACTALGTCTKQGA